MVASNVAIPVSALSVARVVALAGLAYALCKVIGSYFHPRSESDDNEEIGAAPQKRQDKSTRATCTLQKCFTIVTASLFLACIEEVKVFVALRLILIFFLYFLSGCAVFAEASAEAPSRTPVQNMCLLHLSWALQAFLQPGLYCWMELAFKKDAAYVYAIYHTLLAWMCFGLYLTIPESNKHQDEQERETNRTNERVSTAKDTASLSVDGVVFNTTDEKKQAGEDGQQRNSGIEDGQSKQDTRLFAANSVLMINLFLSLLLVPWATSWLPVPNRT